MAVSLNELRLAVVHRAGDEIAATLVDIEEVVLSAAAESGWKGVVFSFRVEGQNKTEIYFVWPMLVAAGVVEIPVILRTGRIMTASEAVRSTSPSGPTVPVALGGREIM